MEGSASVPHSPPGAPQRTFREPGPIPAGILHAVGSFEPSQMPADPVSKAAGLAFLLLMLVLPWTIAPMSIATGLCAALTLWAWIRSRGADVPRTPIEWPAAAWFVAMVISAVFALNPSASLPRISKGFFPLLVLLGAFHGSRPELGRRAIALWFGSAMVASIFGVVVFVVHGASMAARARGPVGHYMTYGGQLLLFTSVTAGIVLATRSRSWRIGAFVAGAAGVVALGATYTRSAWLGLATALAIMAARARPRWLPAMILALAALVVLAPPSYRERLASAFDPRHPNNIERTYMWRAGERMFADHPLTGVGLQDLHPIYERYRSPEAHEAAGHLHSVPIQIAATMGLLGLVAFAWLYFALIRCGAVGLSMSLRAGGLGAGLRLGVIGALAGFFVAGLFEWNFGDEELLYPLFLLAGLAWAARDWDALETRPAFVFERDTVGSASRSAAAPATRVAESGAEAAVRRA
jgi:O-antigen ligase